MDKLKIGNVEFNSRLFIGTGKYPSKDIIKKACENSESEMITLALRRVDFKSKEDNIIDYIPKNMRLLPNTSGAKNADEAIRIARLARACNCGDFIKIEIIPDSKYLMPDNYETIKATKVLADEGFIVMPYMNPDLVAAKEMIKSGAACVMPLGAPIGSNRGIQTKELIRIMIEEINEVPIIVDAGIGKPSHAAQAMEMGADAVLVNTAIASAKNPDLMAKAFKLAVESGRIAYLSGLSKSKQIASASSPLTNFLGEM
ncbi:thiazole synthase [Peptostreptococcaceae bacterium AGR-M142]